MAILHAAGDLVDFTPGDQLKRAAGDRVAYRLRVPSVYERVAWRRAVAKAGGRRHGAFATLAALRRGVVRIMDPGAAKDFVLAAVDEHRGRVEAFAAMGDGDGDPADLAEGLEAMLEGDRALAAVSALVVAGDEVYAQMQADNLVYREIAGIEAARLFVEGWTGLSGDPERTWNGLTDASLGLIPDDHFASIGDRMADLVRPTETESGNFGSPSPGPSGPRSSAAANPQP